MGLPIISADQRLAERHGVKLVLLGFWGLGKTTQLKTLPEASTLFVDLEAGDLAVKDWRGDCIRPKTWPEFCDLVVFLAGSNPALPAEARARLDAFLAAGAHGAMGWMESRVRFRPFLLPAWRCGCSR